MCVCVCLVLIMNIVRLNKHVRILFLFLFLYLLAQVITTWCMYVNCHHSPQALLERNFFLKKWSVVLAPLVLHMLLKSKRKVVAVLFNFLVLCGYSHYSNHVHKSLFLY